MRPDKRLESRPGNRPDDPPRQGPPALSATDWAVLGLLGEGPAHGFALATTLAPGGELGRVWTLPRPVVYQAVRRLRHAGLVLPVGTQASQAGPNRTILTLTPAGRVELARWLDAPVDHVRDVRSLLLLKLALLDRLGRSHRSLAERQLDSLRPGLAALEQEASHAEAFDAVLAAWRLASHRAAVEFLEGLLGGAGNVRGRRGAPP
ncbi:MAG: PadR family transcriptional regulator [Acidimicrobiales bacterium]